jgi:hypothetical protein
VDHHLVPSYRDEVDVVTPEWRLAETQSASSWRATTRKYPSGDSGTGRSVRLWGTPLFT